MSADADSIAAAITMSVFFICMTAILIALILKD
jgi:hypothetical protein